MADHIRALLRWVAAHDLPDRVVLGCCGARPEVGARSLGLVLDRCLADTGIDLPAQLLALGVPRVEVLPCPADPAGAAQTVATWARTFPGAVSTTTPPRGHHLFPRRRGTVLELSAVPLPRRLVLGMGTREELPLDLHQDCPARTLQALTLLTGQGRAALVTPRPEGPVTPPPPTTPPGHEGDAGTATTVVPASALPATVVPGAAVPPPTDGGHELTGAGLVLSASGCTACGVCVRACPTGALALATVDGTATLSHATQVCRGTGSCLTLCPESALTSAGPASLEDMLATPVRDLAHVRVRACTRCGAEHPADEGDLCRVCAYRAGHAFGSVLPPGL